MASGTTAQQTIDVVTPAAGESVTEGTILDWHVKVGDPIRVDATIVEISTDKVDVELPSPATGTVSEILVEEGDTVTVGQVIARIAVGDGASSAAPEQTEPEAPSAPAAPAATEPSAGNGAAETTAPGGNGASAAPAASGNGAAEADAPPSEAAPAGAAQIVDVLTPAAGEWVSEGTILEWHARVGEPIKRDETIVEISTDKVDVELPAPASGTVVELLVAEGETVTVGQVIARIAVGDGASAAAPAADTD